jgi:ABC-type bacteriocin/lantibiotic exporter with double-glycine peptidase domain
VRRAIDTRYAGRTRLLITHRRESLRDADHVVWIDQGRVLAQGPPEKVLPEAAPHAFSYAQK